MTFRASNVVPEEAYTKVRKTAIQLKVNLQSFKTSLASKNADFKLIKGIYVTLSNAYNQLDTLKEIPGLADYAKQQEDDPNYDVVVEFNNLITQIQSAMGWINDHVPSTVSLKTPADWGGPNETVIVDTFTPTQTSDLRTALESVIQAIS